MYLYCPVCYLPYGDTYTYLLKGVSARHNGGGNVAFWDGHAKWMSRSALVNNSPEASILWLHVDQ